MRYRKFIFFTFMILIFILISCSNNGNDDNYGNNIINNSTTGNNNSSAGNILSEEDKYLQVYNYVSNKCFSKQMTSIYTVGNCEVLYQNYDDEIHFACLTYDSSDSKCVMLNVPKTKPSKFYISYARHTIASTFTYKFGDSGNIDTVNYKGYSSEYQEDLGIIRQGIALIYGGFTNYILINSSYRAYDLGF